MHETPEDPTARWRSWAPRFLSILRMVAGAFFVLYGTTKLFAWPAAVMPGGGTAPLMSLAGVAGAIELVGGAFLLAGLFSRSIAFILSGEMAVAYFIGHAPQGFWPVLNGGVDAVLYCFIWLYVSAAGPGPWSIDARRRGDASRTMR
ncbi:MAG TPA: DoxX family protein [Gemmatimonadaceae bacterium]|nr:DoxX family protein [Gemmatimonadaceae bacterium]